MSTKRARAPFDVTLSADKRQTLCLELSRALDDALSARTVSDTDLAYFHTLYEQGRTRTGHLPWADAADLTSPLGTQYVDVLRSQFVRTVMLDPVFVVEGYGESEAKAPFVEEFHSWQLEVEGFQSVFARAAHLALIEPHGVIEVYQETIRRPVRTTIKAALQLDPTTGAAVVNEKLEPVIQRTPDGMLVPVTDDQTPFAEVVVDTWEVIARGPRERVIPYRDFLQLPGHATERRELWGYAKRFWRRIDALQEQVDAKVYDQAAVDQLGTDDEHASETTLAGEPIPMATSQDTPGLAEKELWEVLFLRDLDGKGLRWYVATLHKDQHVLLRLQYDDLGSPRYFPLVPFPRPNSCEGYSYIGHKLITVLEEHTAWRNMLADRASMQLQVPLLRRQGSLWDPDLQPIGPKSIITVRDAHEITPLTLPDVTGPAVERIRDCERAGERLSGINDAAAGVQSDDRRTLGEIQLITQQSLGRSTEAIQNLQETLEELAQVRHQLWKRALAEQSEGMVLPPAVVQSLELRGADLSQLRGGTRITAALLEGQFRFKPRGSVEDADLNRQRYDFNQWIMAMGQLASVNPMVAAVLQTPQAAKALIEQGLRLYNVQDKQAFMGQAAQQAMQAALQQQAAAAMAQQMAGAGLPAGPRPSSPGAPPPAGPRGV